MAERWEITDLEIEIDNISKEADSFRVTWYCAQTLMLLIENLDKKFKPFIDENMKLIFSDDIWEFEYDAIKYIYKCCTKMIEIEESLDNRNQYFNKVYDLFIIIYWIYSVLFVRRRFKVEKIRKLLAI